VEGEAPSGIAGGGGDASPSDCNQRTDVSVEGEAPSGIAGGGGDASPLSGSAGLGGRRDEGQSLCHAEKGNP
ncbi:MAG: hypothetical protein ACE5HN_08270, partial [Nitrospiria bacterium]